MRFQRSRTGSSGTGDSASIQRRRGLTHHASAAQIPSRSCDLLRTDVKAAQNDNGGVATRATHPVPEVAKRIVGGHAYFVAEAKRV